MKKKKKNKKKNKKKKSGIERIMSEMNVGTSWLK